MSEASHEAVRGLTTDVVSPFRYSSADMHPRETPGMTVDAVPVGARVLDVGAGLGTVTELMRDRKNAQVVAIEPNADRAAACRLRGIDTITGYFSAETAESLGKFDVINFSDVIEHIADPAEVLMLARRSLNKGGRVLASVPNVAQWSIRLALLAGNFDYRESGIMDATHLRWFTRKSLSRLFEQTGYRVETLSHTAGRYNSEYKYTPLRLLPQYVRGEVIWRLGQMSPGLFGCQHFIVARPVD